MIEKNRRKGMILNSLWLYPDEIKSIKYIVNKKRDNYDLSQLGDIILTAIKRGDFKER